MVKHIIIWKLKSEYTEEQKKEIKAEAKKRLEALIGKIDGLLKIEVKTELVAGSNGDMMLYSEFDSLKSLEGYQVNPIHIEAATYVRGVVESRSCADFED